MNQSINLEIFDLSIHFFYYITPKTRIIQSNNWSITI